MTIQKLSEIDGMNLNLSCDVRWLDDIPEIFSMTFSASFKLQTHVSAISSSAKRYFDGKIRRHLVLQDVYKTWTRVHGPPLWTTPNFRKKIKV